MSAIKSPRRGAVLLGALFAAAGAAAGGDPGSVSVSPYRDDSIVMQVHGSS